MIITNGECFNEIFQRKTGLNSFAFNEAFMIGEVNEDLFSDEFIALRIYSLNTTLDIYHQKIDDIIKYDYLNCDNIELYFGQDAFCIINVLVLLAYLDKINYHNKIVLNIIDEDVDDVKIVSRYAMQTDGYYALFIKVFIEKLCIKTKYDFINKSIQVYLAYHNGNMLKYIQAKHKIDNKELGFTKEMLAKLYEEGGIDEKDNDDVS